MDAAVIKHELQCCYDFLPNMSYWVGRLEAGDGGGGLGAGCLESMGGGCLEAGVGVEGPRVGCLEAGGRGGGASGQGASRPQVGGSGQGASSPGVGVRGPRGRRWEARGKGVSLGAGRLEDGGGGQVGWGGGLGAGGLEVGVGWEVGLGAGRLEVGGEVGVGLGAGRLEAGGGGAASGQDASRPGVVVRPLGRTPRGWGGDVGSRPRVRVGGASGQYASRPGWGGVAGPLEAEGGLGEGLLEAGVGGDPWAGGLEARGFAFSCHSLWPPNLLDYLPSKQLIKKPKYVQISVESNSHLTGLEDQVKSLEEQVNGLEDEVKDLNEKFSAAQLEMTNKENLIRNLKEEHEQKLHDAIQNKAKQFDKMKHEFEVKIANLDQQLLRSAAENSALPSSLQECSSMVIQFNEKKSQAEAEIEMLKSNIESCEREINSLKYELRINSKELEIGNEEKYMSVRSAEVANKQHLEGVKKIAKLEAECQRLRGLVRKKYPGPAALAQMKLEVESLGRDYGDSRAKKYQGRPSLQANFEQKSSQKSTIPRQPSEGSFSHEANHLPRLASMSEDGNDDNVSCASSWTTALRSDLSHIKKEKNSDSPHKSESASHLDLMDDLLEMEKLAYQSSDTNGAVSNKSISMKLQSRISTVLESLSKEADIQRIQEDLREIVQEMRNAVILQSTKSIVEITLSSKTATESHKELADAMSQIHDFVLFLGKEAKAIQGTTPDGSGINENLDDFSATYVEVISNRLSMVNFVIDLSHPLSNASQLHFNILGYKNSDCINKVALPENKGLQHSREVYANGCAHFSDSTSDPDIPHEGSLVPTSEMGTAADLDAKTNQHYSCDLEKERGSSRSREKEREKRRDKDRMERFLVQVAVSTNKDSVGWMGSRDESTAGERQPRVLLWEIEPLTTFLMYPSPFSLRLKRPWSPGLSSFLGLSNGVMTINSQLPWLQVAWVIRGYNHLISRVLVLLHSCSQGLMILLRVKLIGSKWQ
ncbi:hypothetical protein KY284_022416 [Solanum tuberosum]|nr:hypothetical protein KY284_022416 [Solanum tuberosum]